MKTNIIISIDGNSYTGKSSIAKKIARELNLIHIDSGAMYRAVTLFALEEKIISDGVINEKALIESLVDINIGFVINEFGESEIILNQKKVEGKIRDLTVNDWVSEVAKIPLVRNKMVQLQREIAKAQDKGVIMDGRDIGTTVFPDANVKIFLTAELEVRAERRYNELLGMGKSTTLDQVKENITSRDFLDVNRTVSPLTKPDNAIVIDNSKLSFQETFNAIADIIKGL